MEMREASCGRGPQRRCVRRFVVRERRSGFERRSRQRWLWAAALERSLVYLRANPVALAALLVLANALSLVDLALTHTSLDLGAVEANLFMRYFLSVDPAQAAIVKVGLVLAVSLAIWRLRRLRRALELAVFLVSLYGVVVVYELIGISDLL
jgi:hypothetical protein